MPSPLLSPPLLKRRRTKIVATLGPASREAATIEALIRAGVNVFRLNLTHGEHIEHRTAFERVAAARERVGLPVAVMADLCGPKVRVGKVADGQMTVTAGDRLTVTVRDVEGGPGLIPVSYKELPADVQPGDRILINDGMVELQVEAVVGEDVACVVQTGGMVGTRKGVNLPGVSLSFETLTEKDRADAHFALDLGVDYLALSFVRRVEDVEELKNLIAAARHVPPVIAKIERPEVLEVIDEVIEASDGLMVARGDLGVELTPEAVPIVQRGLVRQARLRSKPVIVATQMLESMVAHPRPTRAEVSDVSHAVFGGTDAVMLSAETAAGAFPIQAVQMMDRVARQAEGWQWANGAFRALSGDLPGPDGEEGKPGQGGWAFTDALPLRLAVARSMAQLARELRVRAIVVRSRGGRSARVTSSTRPQAPVVALTTDPTVYRRMALLWGVEPRLVSAGDFEQPLPAARREAVELELAGPGDVILLLSGFGKGEPVITVLTV
jgi:pyruvate kinase